VYIHVYIYIAITCLIKFVMFYADEFIAHGLIKTRKNAYKLHVIIGKYNINIYIPFAKFIKQTK